MERYPALITLPRGLEEVACLELKRLGVPARPRPFGLPGWVWIEEIEPLELARICYLARTIDRGLLVLARGEIRRSGAGLEDLYRLVQEVDWSKWLPYQKSFRFRGKRHGEHQFRSMDAHRVAGQAVVDQILRRCGWRPPVNLKAPDIPLRIDIAGTEAIVSLDFVGREALHRRMARSYHHPSALSPVIAAALVHLSGWLEAYPEPEVALQGRSSEISAGTSAWRIPRILTSRFWDPTCGGATIPIEAASILRAVPAGFFRKRSLAFTRLPLFSGIDWSGWFDRFDRKIDWERRAPILASDVSPKSLEGARRNLEAAGVADTVELRQIDLLRMETVPEAGTVITNPPYGIRSGSPRQAAKVHRALVEVVDRSVGRGRVVAITPRTAWIAPLWLERGFRQLTRLEVRSGDLPVQVACLER